jgi:predicted GIY-YIG superfamily endonuclease
MEATNIYVLRLENGKVYVGKSNDVNKRYSQHLDGSGSAWTKKYKPVSIEKVILNASPFDEDKITKEYMLEYGVENVRGGSYTQIKLPDEQLNNLEKEICSAKNLCFKCGGAGHFAKYCNATSNSDSEEEDEYEWGCDYCDRTFTTKFGCSVHEKSCSRKQEEVEEENVYVCYRCGRDGHKSPQCYAKYDVDGNML